MNFLWILIGLVIFAIVMTILVAIHEGGHFIAAKKAGILCHEFSIGMGPIIYQKKKGETVYSIRALPIGGFVSMAGEEVEDNVLKGIQKVKLQLDQAGRVAKIIINLDNPKYKDLSVYQLVSYDLIGTKDALPDELFIEVTEENADTSNRYIVNRDCLVNYQKKEEIQIAPYDRNFVNKPLLNRFLSVFAGPFMNFVLAIFIFFLIGLFAGYADTEHTILGGVTVVEGSNNTLEVGDELESINGVTLTDWASISTVLDSIAQGGEKFTGSITVVAKGKDPIVIRPSVFIYSIELAFKVDGTNEAIIGSYSSNNEKTKAYKAGLREGDKIIAINGDTTLSTKSALLAYFTSGELEKGQKLEITYERDGVTKTTEIENYSKKVLDAQGIVATKVQLGITCQNKFHLGKLLYMPFVETAESCTMIFKTLGALFTDKSIGVDDLSGPVGIFNLLKEATKQGILTLLSWIAILSVNLGFINLLPLPALDGGRLAFMVYEAITKKKPSPKVENTIHTIGFLLLMALMLFISFNDVLRCIGIK